MSPPRCASFSSASNPSESAPRRSPYSFRHRSDPAELDTLASFLRRLPSTHRYAVELRHRTFYENADTEAITERLLGDAGVEWISLDTTSLYDHSATSRAERGARRQKPHLPRRLRALTDRPVVRLIGADDPTATRAGWEPWLPTLADWLRQQRAPTVFVHTPDNLAAPPLARQLYAAVADIFDTLPSLPDPRRAQPPTERTLF
jgi:uncharacterized protein YecE (DUF72 family)